MRSSWCRRWQPGFAVALAATLWLGALAAAQSPATPPRISPPPVSPPSWVETGAEVDVALVLAVDISYSMDMEEQALQRDGYIAALTSPVVLEAIRKGVIGKIAVTYLEWAGTPVRRVVADWKIIGDEASARAFADEIRSTPIQRARRTSITNAINFSMERLQVSGLRPLRRVIDISGDGPNNDGGPVTEAREWALASGVVINGLPILLNRSFSSAFDIETLDDYYEDCVIGGPGSFMEVVSDKSQFRAAIRNKILREVAQATLSDTSPVRGKPGRSDCLIGEKLWRQNWERN